MKTIFFSLLLLIPLTALAQQGTVLYEECARLDFEALPGRVMPTEIPPEITTERLLLFDGVVSLMKSVPLSQNGQLEPESPGIRFRVLDGRVISGSAADDATYTNYEANVQIEKRDFLERTFLITDEPLRLTWRMTGERAEFLGYLSQKAVATTEDGTTVEAWFTPEIPAPVGPARYGGLPGLILVLSENVGQRSFVAKEVSREPLAGGNIQMPARGRQVTRQEYDTIVEERMREMRIQGGGRMIRRPGGN